MAIDRNGDVVTACALKWLSYKLSDEDLLEEWLWGNYIEAGLEVHPSKEEVDALVPEVREALMHAQRLPEMDADVRDAIAVYLAGFDKEVFDSEYANSDRDEEWADAVQSAYMALRSPLHRETAREV